MDINQTANYDWRPIHYACYIREDADDMLDFLINAYDSLFSSPIFFIYYFSIYCYLQ